MNGMCNEPFSLSLFSVASLVIKEKQKYRETARKFNKSYLGMGKREREREGERERERERESKSSNGKDATDW